MIIGNALDLPAGATVALSIALAFAFGYSFTSLPLLRAGMTLGAVIPLALASDTISITIMEIVDNSIMLLIPGAMDAGLDQFGFYAALAARAPDRRCRRVPGQPLADRPRPGARGHSLSTLIVWKSGSLAPCRRAPTAFSERR